MIHITGDFHGDINRFNKCFIPDEPTWGEGDYLIICGDFGFLFLDNEDEQFLPSAILAKNLQQHQISSNIVDILTIGSKILIAIIEK